MKWNIEATDARGGSSRTCTSCVVVDSAWRKPYTTGREARTTMRAAPACKSGIACLPIGRITYIVSAASGLVVLGFCESSV